MKVYLATCVVALHAFSAWASFGGRSLRSPHSFSGSLVEERQHVQSSDAKLIPWVAKKQWAHNQHNQRMHMLAREQPSPSPSAVGQKPIEGCIACFGVQVRYGKYVTEDGDQTDNSYYLFKDPTHKQGDEALPLIIHFHHGNFFSGKPWKLENKDIKSYVSKGFAVVSVGYRLVTEKYSYQSEGGTNKTEELIHVSKKGKLSLDKGGRTMADYKVRFGKQEFITKYLYDATQMIENIIENADKFGLDANRIVFVGESVGGAGMQYLTWVYHQWNVGRYTPLGMVYNNAQLNYPVENMLEGAWDLFVETMGPQVKLSDVVSEEACPAVLGNHMCGSPLGEASDYELCNHVWNKKTLKRFCGDALKSATLGEVKKQQEWRNDGHKSSVEAVVATSGIEKLWYNAENMQTHVPHDPFYIYVENSLNGTRAVDVSHHSIFALNFAKYAEMSNQSGLQYTVYYTDFEHMTEADRGTQRVEVSNAIGDLGPATGLMLPAAALAGDQQAGPSPAGASPSPAAAVSAGPSPAAAPGPAPAPVPALVKMPGMTVYNYLSTHNWREDFAGRDVEAASAEERILYACLAAKVGPFKEDSKPNKTLVATKESSSPLTSLSLSSLSVALLASLAF